jgi:hypothetical protein
VSLGKILVMSKEMFHIAQVNIFHLIEPLDSERLADFVAAIDSVNSAAESAPGFIWRLKSEEEDVNSHNAFEWDLGGSAGVLTNMSVWTSFESLKDFVHSPLHLEVLRKKRNWSFRVTEATTALWWIPAGSIPTIQDAESRVIDLRRNGPSATAFDLSKKFDFLTVKSD